MSPSPTSAYTTDSQTRDYRPSYDATNQTNKSGYQTTQTTASGSSYATYGVYGDVAQSSGSNLNGLSNHQNHHQINNGSTYRKPDAKRKVFVTGDGGCGKTCLLIMYSENRFPEAYIPTVFENYVTMVPFPSDSSKFVELALWDTAGQEEYDRLRPLISHFCEGVPLILVGTKTDLRRDQRTLDLLAAQGTTPITAQQGQSVAKEIGAIYMECSAKNNDGVKELFNAALKLAMRGRKMEKMKRRVCKIL
ncbi:hypothetical protein CROQUDRAFT_314712 [Cronartium quercuum f. sp. fusiforme G11]|uniref:Uncharacterized protein n=1 Tax=Cronartium quercuum f. sp. fusiforme G11 TaxID=708437 RepID=A0A9P6NUI3_9BASI|nr:hypothetical protein CROQUDRAFT_314712 [Cronartium quercuum f. sp. fusiforme G11]